MGDLWPTPPQSIEGDVDSFHDPLERRARTSSHCGWGSGPAERETW